MQLLIPVLSPAAGALSGLTRVLVVAWIRYAFTHQRNALHTPLLWPGASIRTVAQRGHLSHHLPGGPADLIEDAMKNIVALPTGVQIEYSLSGPEKGDVLLFVHGRGPNLRQFEPQRGYFEAEYRVLLISLRGHGKSTRRQELHDKCNIWHVDTFALCIMGYSQVTIR